MDAQRKDWEELVEFCKHQPHDCTKNPMKRVDIAAILQMDSAYREAEAALCRAREATNQPITGDNWTRVISSVLHIIAPGNSSPCRHAAIAERVNDTERITQIIHANLPAAPGPSCHDTIVEGRRRIARAVQAFLLKGEG